MYSRAGFASAYMATIVVLALATQLPAVAASGKQKAHDIDRLIAAYHEQDRFMGTALVAEAGKVIHKAGYGMANMEWDIPNRPDIRFRLGSITKQFTSAIIMQLVEEKKLDLETPISTYLPEYREDTGGRVTTHHLLSHTSGIPSYTSLPGFFEDLSRDPYDPDEFTSQYCSDDLEFEPGSKWNYSNSGYFLLGLIIEKITLSSYEQVLQERILDPLGLKDTGYDHHGTILERRASGYSQVLDEYENASYLDMSIPYAAGSLYSTVEDLYLWDQALHTDKLLSAAAREKMFTPVLNDYGYGWAIQEIPVGDTDRKVKTVSHGGGINGFNTLITRLVDDRHLIVLLNNTDGAPLGEMMQDIVRVLYDQPFEMPELPVGRGLVDALFDKGLDAAMANHATAIEADPEYAPNLEQEINQRGYELLMADHATEAVEAFRLNAALFPASSNVHDSLGEALMATGQRQEAIRSYARSLEMDPDNANAVTRLAALMEMPRPEEKEEED